MSSVEPPVLSCRACDSGLSLSDNPAVRSAEMAAFCDAHSGHGERVGFAVQMPVPAQRSRHADLPRLPGLVRSAAALCGAEILAALALRRPEWPFR
jgi:hypothetical protein